MQAIQVLHFKHGHANVTKDTPNLEKYGAFLVEKNVVVKNGLGLQHEGGLYTLIHIGSGWSLQSYVLKSADARRMFEQAADLVNWVFPIQELLNGKELERVQDALKIGKDMENI